MQKFKKIVFCLFSAIVCVSLLFSHTLFISNNIVLAVDTITQKCLCVRDNPIKSLINLLFNSGSTDDAGRDDKAVEVFVGGIPLGFALSCNGAIIVGVGSVTTINGEEIPTKNAQIKSGDILYKIEDHIVTSALMIEELINDREYAGKEINVVIIRNGQMFQTTLYPALDKVTQKYRLGLWIRDDSAGVGTLSYIRTDNKRFGALGHPVCDIDTGSILPISSGSIYSCDIIGVKKGERGSAGELKGLFLRGGQQLGVLDNNTAFGVFGQIDEKKLINLPLKKTTIANKKEIKMGNATILTTVDGQTPEEFNIDIVKINAFASDGKNMVIRITDQRLIDKTGGIVQGMSGSPILQNGKMIGVVTHVFVTDPTKGFASFVGNMIDS